MTSPAQTISNEDGRGTPVPVVAVVGGGAAGTLSAVHLLRAAPADGVEVILIDREGEFGPGLPYRTRDPFHVLNVPAARMGGISGDPEHFHRWLLERSPETGPETFATRGLFGEYLRELLDETERSLDRRSKLTKVTGEVLSVGSATGNRLKLQLDDGRELEADRLVLALGHLPSGDPVPPPAELVERGVYIPNPWAPGALEAASTDDTVLIIGTGLTMVDVVAVLGRAGGPSIRAVSRHGLVPRRHRDTMTRPESFALPDPAVGLDPLIETVFARIEEVSAAGGDWRDVLDSLRTPTPAYWRGLSREERRRFVIDINRFWDVHRFRIAPAVADRFEALQSEGRISVTAGAIRGIEAVNDGAAVSVESGGITEEIRVDRVINCTGAGAGIERAAPPLIADLFATGRGRPDDLSIGLDVSPDGRLIESDGGESERIHVVGGLRKGVEWEAIGVTEIRDHAAAAARQILGDRETLNTAPRTGS